MSKILVNGALTEEIDIKNGIRQGCPLSMPLYALCADPLVRKIENDKEIKGLKLGKIELKTQMYADDLTAFTTDKKSLDSILEILKRFEEPRAKK